MTDGTSVTGEAATKVFPFTFGEILPHLVEGNTAARAGWNGKGMRIGIVLGNIPRDHEAVHKNGNSIVVTGPIHGFPAKVFDVGGEGTSIRLPHFVIAHDNVTAVWNPTTADVLANDWTLV